MIDLARVPRLSCRACQGRLEEVLTLGALRLNAFPATLHDIPDIPAVPLTLMVCKECGLAQLDRSVPPDLLYRTYWYRSGINEAMVEELRSIVREACGLVTLSAQDWVLDIGANDGTLLAAYQDQPGYLPLRAAIEPARNLTKRLEDHCDRLVQDYFPSERLDGQYRIITAIACAYDVEDPTAFFQAIHDLLAPGGVAIIQFQDLAQQIESAAFDNVCHEHLLYYSLWSLTHLFLRTGLRIQRATRTPINGGSLRVVLRRSEDAGDAEPSVLAQLLYEAGLHLDTPTIRTGDRYAFRLFAQKVAQAQRQISAVLQQALDAGAVIDLYGASTKGNGLLQVLGIGPGQIRQAIDRSVDKRGCYTITGIPIVGEGEAGDAADLWLTPIWQFRESVLRRNQAYLEGGGGIIFPLPQVEVVRARAAGRGELTAALHLSYKWRR